MFLPEETGQYDNLGKRQQPQKTIRDYLLEGFRGGNYPNGEQRSMHKDDWLKMGLNILGDRLFPRPYSGNGNPQYNQGDIIHRSYGEFGSPDDIRSNLLGGFI